ncbi:MAG: DUF3450 domain-containing protein [Syntrophotaleaceae bacterium]
MLKSERFKRLVVLSLLCVATQAAAVDVDSVQEATVSALAREQKSQQQTDSWSAEKQALANSILDQKTRLQWNRYQNRQYQEYIKLKEEQLVALREQKESMRQLRMALEPYLDQVLDNLARFAAADLPFLPEERADRLAFLRESLGDPELALGEKLRRILEGLKVEAEYGNHIEVTSEKLELEGQSTQVEVLRLGRVGLFYLTKDGTSPGVWNAAGKSWVRLEEKYAAPLRSTMDIVERKRAAELVELPL